jgi:hypothetical protein
MNIQMIPLNRLIPSPANVRKTGTALGVEELAASIAAHGLLQNLQVRPAKGGKFESTRRPSRSGVTSSSRISSASALRQSAGSGSMGKLPGRNRSPRAAASRTAERGR